MIKDDATDIDPGVPRLPDVDGVALVQNPSTTIPLAVRGLLRMERTGMYGRLLQVLDREEAKESRPEPWGETERRILSGLRRRVLSALAVEAEHGKGCLLNPEDPLVIEAARRGRAIMPADIAKARRFRDEFPEVYGKFIATFAQESSTGPH